MSWSSEIVKRSADRFVCLEIELGDQVLYFCDRPLIENERYWRPALLEMTPLVRQLDPETRRVSFLDVTVTLRNDIDADTGLSLFADLLENDAVFEGSIGRVSLALQDESGVLWREVLFSGLCQPGELRESSFTLNLHVPLEDRLNLLQRHTTDTAFGSNLPAPVPMNVVLGECTGAARGGAVKCIPLDLASATKTFLVAQHRVHSIENVYRLRAGAWTEVTSGLTRTTSALDDSSHYSARIAISSGHVDGDEYYADVQGLQKFSGGYMLNLDGSSRYAWCADHADFDITGDLTFEALVRPGTLLGVQRLCCKAASFNQRSWIIDMINSNGSIRLCGYTLGTDASEWVVRTAAGVLAADTWTRIKICYDASAAEVSFYRDGIEIARGNNTSASNCTVVGTIGTALFSGSSRLDLFNFAGIHYWTGSVAWLGLWATESDDGSSLAPTHAAARGFWHFEQNLNDSSGGDHTLTGVAITSGDYSLTTADTYGTQWQLARNPAESFRALLTDPDCWGLADSDLDGASFAEAAAWCAARGYDSAGVWGGVIPEQAGQLECEGRQWELLALIARNFDHAIVPDRAGRIALKRIAANTVEPDGLVHYRQHYGEINGATLAIRHRPLTLVNEARGLYKHAHSSAVRYDRYLRAYNAASQQYFGITREAQWPYRFHRALTPLKAVVGPQVQLQSGRTREISMTTPGLWGLQPGSDIGDVVLVTASGVFGSFQARQVLITSVSTDLLAGTVTLRGLTLGDTIGAVAFSSEETAEVTAERSTFIGATQYPIQGDSFTEAHANSGYGNLAHLRHGHHYSTYYTVSIGYGNVNWRSILRWRLPAAEWGGRTVRAVTIQLQVLDVPSLPYDIFWDTYRSGWSGAALHLFNLSSASTPPWDETSTFNGIWSGGSYVGDRVGPAFAGGAGSRSVILDAGGVAAFAAAAAGTGQGSGADEVNICLGEMSQGDYTSACRIASTRHSTAAYRPRAIITYLVS